MKIRDAMPISHNYEIRTVEAPFSTAITVFLQATGVEVDLPYEAIAALADTQGEMDEADPDGRVDWSVQWEIPYEDLIAYVIDGHRCGDGALRMRDSDRDDLVALATALETAAGQLRSAISEAIPVSEDK